MCFFNHKWIVVDVQQITSEEFDVYTYEKSWPLNIKRFLTIKKTKVLYKCEKCGEVKVDYLDGHWTKDQIQ